ncbi:hypothetical protein GGX14DRAFT_559018 [Mycena pura]|uniref:Uncharacterized protein n=1 Tax=Mycena pura TaxID=153505 RepID=A0AAD6YJA6_9AGAR|nr:hypothetical protein GGX14DRAFT_559018 [Mycena pura]
MAPPKKALPEGFVASPGDNRKVKCQACSEASPPGEWMQAASVSAHLKSKNHHRATTMRQQRSLDRGVAQAVQSQAPQTLSLPRTDLYLHGEQHNLGNVESPDNDFWDAYNADPSTFRIELDGTVEERVAKEMERIEAELDKFGEWNDVAIGYALGVEGERDDEEAQVQIEDMLAQAQIEDMVNALGADAGDTTTDTAGANEEWFPYPSKVFFLLDAMDNLPRLRISESLMKLFIFFLKELGVKQVPTIGAFRKFQASLRTSGAGVPSIPCTSVQGKVFYLNDIRKLVANDWCNPLIREHIHVYPEKPANGVVSELWHAAKWRCDMDTSILSPMYNAGNSRHYYINELAQLKTGSFVIPLRWVTYQGDTWADAYAMNIDHEGIASVLDAQADFIRASDLCANFLDLKSNDKLPLWSILAAEAGYPHQMPNPDRAVANGRPFYTSFINYFSDDVSGNRSKSWNKHWNAYFTHVNLPRKLLQQEAHIHFLSTSQHATVGEQFCEVKKIIEGTYTDPIPVKDPKTNEEALVRLAVNADSSDNPMQSEQCSHIGSQGNFPCRKCIVGGPQVDKQTNAGYYAFFSEGTPRSKDYVLNTVKHHLNLACQGVASHVKDHQTETGIKDPYAQYWIDKILDETRKMRATVKAQNPHLSGPQICNIVYQVWLAWVQANYEKMINPFFLLKGHDPTQDTPVEILHTILLGNVKYIWHYSHTTWKDDTKTLYVQRLQATSTEGLNVPPIRAAYIMQYANSLVGRQLKIVIQTAVFHVYDVVDTYHFTAWKTVGVLAVYLWVPEIDNMDEYCDDLTVAVANVLDAFAAIDPSKILLKIKLHLLRHLPNDARRFGPLVGVATELFESFNAVFRAASILSNHRAPSRDIALQLADQEGTRLRTLGGWWLDNESNEWKRAGPAVRQYIQRQPNLQRLLGWTGIPNRSCQAGTAPETRSWEAKTAAEILGASEQDWFKCKELTALSGDACTVCSWVFFRSTNESIVIGRLVEILSPAEELASSAAIAVIDCFEVAAARHAVYEMPVLLRPHTGQLYRAVKVKDILFSFNAQHDCSTAQCSATATRRIEQERVETDLMESVIEHRQPDIFIINTSAFHNFHLLRLSLPRHSTRPVPSTPENAREALHFQHAAKLRAETTRKRRDRVEEAQRKAQEAAAAREAADRLEREAAELAADDGPPSQRLRIDDTQISE